MPYSQFIEAGRIVVISFGPLANKTAVIVDIVDHNRAIVDFVDCDEPRQVMPIKRIKPTDFHVKFERGASPEEVKKHLEGSEALKGWNESKWCQRLKAQEAKSHMNDFQRFKYEKLAAQREKLIKEELSK